MLLADLDRFHRPACGPLRRACQALFGNPDFNIASRIRAAHLLRTARRFGPIHHLFDAGCGSGEVADLLARRLGIQRVEGIDVDPQEVSRAQATFPGYAFRTGDLTTAHLETGADLVICVDVLEHVPDDGAVARTLHAACAPGGHVLVHTPNERERRLFKALDRFHHPDHVRDGYTHASLTRLLAGAGLEVLEVRSTFGFCGNLAWEGKEFLRPHPERKGLRFRIRRLLRPLLFPALVLLGCLDVRLPIRRGNSLLAIARRGTQPGNGGSIDAPKTP